MDARLIAIVVALIYIAAKIYLEKRLAPLDAAGSDQRLANLAYSWGCSTYELFQRAASDWKFTEQKVESDFARYLSSGFIPQYVLDFVAHNSTPNDQSYYRLLYAGGRPPYL